MRSCGQPTSSYRQAKIRKTRVTAATDADRSASGDVGFVLSLSLSDVDVAVAWPPAVSHMSTTVHSSQLPLTGSRGQASFLWSTSPPAPLMAGQSADEWVYILLYQSLFFLLTSLPTTSLYIYNFISQSKKR